MTDLFFLPDASSTATEFLHLQTNERKPLVAIHNVEKTTSNLTIVIIVTVN